MSEDNKEINVPDMPDTGIEENTEKVPRQAFGEKVIEKYNARTAFEELSPEEQERKATDFKSKIVPLTISVVGCALALLYMLWMFGVIGK